MTTYYTNLPQDVAPITGYNNQVSEYANLVEEYLSGGGKITKCAYEARTTSDTIPDYGTTPEEVTKLMKGSSLFDTIEMNKGKEFNDTLENYFDNPEKY
tara:strand:+ start:532 stop:828 length:297 start_codon:yes stop_codon:yes gene_type:complete